MVSRRIYSYELRIEGTEICARHGGDDVEQGLAIALTARDQALRGRARRAISTLSSEFWLALRGQHRDRITLDCLEDPIDAISHH